jgi:LmbE family N-acetylglucosaminyl deacetylase
MKIFLSPHNDDEILFGLDILIEERPLVVIITHAKYQGDNGCQRAIESYKAIKDLGLSICYLQIDEDKLTEEALIDKLKDFYTTDVVYIPAPSDNPQHNLVSEVAKKIFRNTYEYNNYLNGVVNKETKYPELREVILRNYKTQINNQDTAHYFT